MKENQIGRSSWHTVKVKEMLHLTEVVILLLHSATANFIWAIKFCPRQCILREMLTNYHSEASDQDDKNLKIRLYNIQLKELVTFSLEKK